ncbi:ATP-binding cassette domain-containing protein [Caldilinea sp.]|uniref:sugar ABC transporter ATP-binding protein n=1 Tax=Caldilinea sp. TaxID=2293560 RepID=UPI002C9096CA|nr:sugar ABC transporter ATP-binding protein [Caldilinea sp.]HRA65621.1 sugar ABC transporter ATP-binding protein [Caldilinea sp.]
MSDDIILDFRNVTKRFPGVTALDNVSMQIRRGEIHGLCGENGAGKSTLMKILSGVYPYGTYEGSVIYEGKELNLGAGAIRQARDEGIAIVYQELTLVPNMTVGENVFLGKEPSVNGSIDWSELYANTRDILAKYRLDVSPQAVVKHLGVGKMQMVEIAKALSENAKILILDEPTSALTESEIDKLMEILENLRGHGVTCIYITHKLEEFFRITDSVTILRDGKTVTTQPTRQLTQEKLVSYMVGREMKERFPRGHRQPREVIFEVADLQAVDPNETSRTVLDGVTFNLRRGEILGIAGLMGSGRTELVTTIFGEYGKITGGVIKLEGEEVHISDARDAMHKGISLVPEDRKGQGLVLMQSILKNISLANLDQFSAFFRIDADAEMVAATQQAKSLGVKAPNLQAQVDSLSGGNQQKVVIAKWLLSNPKILIMDDPTRGIDVGAKYEIYKLMNDLAERGVAIIMISSELEEVLGMSDRIMVMHEGRSTLTLDIAEASQERIMALATGIADEILPV